MSAVSTASQDTPIAVHQTWTSDIKTVIVWSDGDLTGALGQRFPGAKVQKNLALSLLIADEATLFDAREMGCLIKAANTLAKKGEVLRDDLRQLAHKFTKRLKGQ